MDGASANEPSHMSPTEAMMWQLEADPWLNPSAGSLSLYDGAVDVERFSRLMANAAATVPRLRQRVLTPSVPGAAPRWVFDREFELEWHVREIGAPGSGTLRELLDWVAHEVADAYDRSRPLWRFTVVSGLEGGRSALLAKLHHTIGDGASAIRMAQSYVSFEPHSPDPVLDLRAVLDADPEPDDGWGSGTRDLVGQVVKGTVDFGRRLIDTVSHPDRVRRGVGDAVDLTRTAIDQLHPAGSPLWVNRSRRRHCEVLDLPLAAVRTRAKALGGTINDFFLTGAVEAAHRYHRALGADAPHFHITFVVSTRSSTDDTNAFTPVPVELPGGDMDLTARFGAVHDLVRKRRAEVHGGGPLAALAAVAGSVPTAALGALARQQAAHIDFATSNLPGFPLDTYMAGARTIHSYPFGPLAGTPFNLTQVSMGNSLDIGLHLDPAAVTEPELLRRSLEDAYAALLA